MFYLKFYKNLSEPILGRSNLFMRKKTHEENTMPIENFFLLSHDPPKVENIPLNNIHQSLFFFISCLIIKVLFKFCFF